MPAKLAEMERNWIMFKSPVFYWKSSSDPFKKLPPEIPEKAWNKQYHMSKIVQNDWTTKKNIESSDSILQGLPSGTENQVRVTFSVSWVNTALVRFFEVLSALAFLS